eukprot:jgi/Mesvir1/10950/Mv11491-RA.1
MSCAPSPPCQAADGAELPQPPPPTRKKAADRDSSPFADASFVEEAVRVSRGEVPANERGVAIARNRLEAWLASVLEPRSGAAREAAKEVSSSASRHRLAVSNVWRHLHAHFDRVLEECEEMRDGYGRGALLVRVHHLTQAARSVIVDWATTDELKEACLRTYWRAMMHDDRSEFVVAICFEDPGGSRRHMWVSELMTKSKSSKWMEKNPGPAVPPFRTWTRVNASGEPFAPVCLGHYCGKRLTRGEERSLCVCKDADFCSAVCSVASHDCDAVRRLRANVDKCVRSAHALYHGVAGLPPFRCPHEWKVSMGTDLVLL